MKMGKFKWLAILMVLLILMSPIALLFLPSWGSKLSPMLNLVDVLMGEGAEDKILLGGFGFVDGDETSLTLFIELGINNTDGPEMLFPALNLSFNYGSSHLGDGWVNPAVTIPADSDNATVPIYAKMYKGDAFNQFLLSLLAGGLSLSISSGEAFIFLDTFGGIPLGSLTIPLPTIPLPSIDLGGAGVWPPTIHGVFRGDVVADQPVVVQANVTDRGGGVETVILSWTNGTAWYNQSMDGIPLKEIMGGGETLLGTAFRDILFPAYPASPIPTTWRVATVNGTIPGHAAGMNISYKVYAIDVFGYSTLVPTVLPTNESGADPDTIDLLANTFSYTVNAAPLANYTAQWIKAEGEAELTEDIFETLEDTGIDIMGAVMAGSEGLASLSELELSAEAAAELEAVVLSVVLPMVEYLEIRGVNPFELLDQLLGLSGGIPGIDDNPWNNENSSLAMDLLSEGGIGLSDLVTLLAVNMSATVDEIAGSIIPPLEQGDTFSAAVFNMMNATVSDPELNETFFDWMRANDVFYTDFAMRVAMENVTDGTITDYTEEAESADVNDVPLSGEEEINLYFGSPTSIDLLSGNPVPGPNFTVLNFDLGTFSSDMTFGDNCHWEYFNGSQWVAMPILTDVTQNFTQSGRILFAPPTSLVKTSLTINGSGVDTIWVRLNLNATLTGALANTVEYSRDTVPYWHEAVNVDMLGRREGTMIPNVTDSINNMLLSMNGTNGYHMMVWSILGSQGLNTTEKLEFFNATFVDIQGPVTGAEIVAASSPVLMVMIYAILGLAVIGAKRGQKGTYAISPIRVKKWYDSMVVTPSLKTREEMEKYKMK